MVYFIVSLMEFFIFFNDQSRLSPFWYVYTEVLCASLGRYNHKPNERFYRRQFAFIVITH